MIVSDALSLVSAVQARIGYLFKDPELLARALTHASMADSRLESNERLEFLGDAVLGLITCELIYDRYPHLLEGEMTKIKSTVVSRQTCSAIAKNLDLEDLLRLGRGMQGQRALPQSISAAVLESIVAAVYLDGGFEAARAFLIPILGPLIDQADACGHQENFKSVLQHHAQQLLNDVPTYIVLDEKGPDHAKCFEIAVEIGARRFPSSWGQSKKQAEQQAALAALSELGVASVDDAGQVRLVGKKAADAAPAVKR